MKCKYCGEACIHWGFRPRKVAYGDGVVKRLEVPRYRCKTCGRTFTVYENEILPGVHFSKTIVEGKVETYEYPSESTLKRWKRKRKNHAI